MNTGVRVVEMRFIHTVPGLNLCNKVRSLANTESLSVVVHGHYVDAPWSAPARAISGMYYWMDEA